MILVTVGMHSRPFDRLVKAADELAALVDEKVVIQRGVSNYEPQQAENFRFVSSREMDDLLGQARVVVAQPGAGTVLLAAKRRKPLVLVPRLRRRGEVLDDHQMELAKATDRARLAIAVLDPSGDTLREAIERATASDGDVTHRKELLCALRRTIGAWSGGNV